MRFPVVLTAVGVARLITRGITTAHDLATVVELLTALNEQFEELAAANEMVADDACLEMAADDASLDVQQIRYDADWLGAMAAEFEKQAKKAQDTLAVWSSDAPVRARPGECPATGCKMA